MALAKVGGLDVLFRHALAAWLVFQEAAETRQVGAIFERIRGTTAGTG